MNRPRPANRQSLITVRPAYASDASGIVSLARALARHVEDPDPGDDPGPLLAAAFSPDPWCECLVALLAETVVGFVLFCRRFEAHTGVKTLWVADLAVAGSQRGQGIGKALLQAVQERAADLGAVSVSLEVWKQNHAALRFYSQAGAIILDDRHVLHLTTVSEAEP